MTALIRKCPSCGAYTMREFCATCGQKTNTAHPPKYSPDDKYRIYKARLGRNLISTLMKSDKV